MNLHSHTTAYQRGRDARRYEHGTEVCRETGNPARDEWLRGYNDMDAEMGRWPDVSALELSDIVLGMIIITAGIVGVFLFVFCVTKGLS